MEKRRITVTIGNHACSFYSDDPEEYIAALEQRANAVMKQTAPFSGASASMNAALSVVFLTDALMRAEAEKSRAENSQPEIKRTRKSGAKAAEEDQGQISVWELFDAEES